jgi:hypothetical protein
MVSKYYSSFTRSLFQDFCIIFVENQKNLETKPQ